MLVKAAYDRGISVVDSDWVTNLGPSTHPRPGRGLRQFERAVPSHAVTLPCLLTHRSSDSYGHSYKGPGIGRCAQLTLRWARCFVHIALTVYLFISCAISSTMSQFPQFASGSSSTSSLSPPQHSLAFPPPSPGADAFQPPLYETRSRQPKFVETMTQRRERVEFLRRREWTRRIAEWIDHSSNADAKELTHITYSWVDILAAADAVDDLDDVASPPYTPDEPSEPYVIYTASPRSSSASRSDAYTPSHPHTHSPMHHIPPPTIRPRRSGLLPRSRHSSLTSISEEDEPSSASPAAPCF